MWTAGILPTYLVWILAGHNFKQRALIRESFSSRQQSRWSVRYARRIPRDPPLKAYFNHTQLNSQWCFLGRISGSNEAIISDRHLRWCPRTRQIERSWL